MKLQFIQPQVNTVGLVGHWKLWDGTVFDYSLRSHLGTLKGTAFYTFPGVEMDGNSDYIEIADHVDFTPALAPLSISAWVNMTDARDFQIASKGVYNTDGEWQFYTAGAAKIVFYCSDESVADCRIGRYYDVALTSYQNQWVHFVGTYDGGTLSSGIKIYLNGARVDDLTSESNAGSFVAVENLTHAVWIGRYGNIYADGKIDDVMIFNVEKSATEVKSIYEVTRQRYGV